MIYGPFSTVCGLYDCAISLHVHITYERKDYEAALKHYEEVGGENATGQDWHLARAWKNIADSHKHTLDVLERLAADFEAQLTPEALKDIHNTLSYIDEQDKKKAG
ncbi:MAG: hypothetical protein IJQ08_04245 [Synergistaceae bacterium]|nr:hypothetical protein [Synergistaceae bacterium]